MGSSHKVMNADEKMRRFERSEIILHWVNAAPFLVLILTGALNILSRFELFIPPNIGAIRIIHKIAGVLWIAGIGYSFFFVGRELNIANTRDQFKIGLSDVSWAIKAVRSVFDPHIEVHRRWANSTSARRSTRSWSFCMPLRSSAAAH